MATPIEGKVRLAIIGSGGITGAHGKGILEYADRVECVALCDISDANMQIRAEQLGGVARRYEDWKLMLAEMAGDIDAILIGLPHHLHAPCILDCCAAGKHVLCEKPMCISLDEGDRIQQAVADSGITYMSAHNQLFMPAVQEAKRRLDAGELGTVYWIRSMDCFLAGGGKSDPFEGTWRQNFATQGGGELIDTGYHPTYRLLHLAGAEIAAVRGSMGRFVQRIDGDDTASVQVRFTNGVIGEIFTSWAMPLPHGSYQIHVIGSQGQLFGSGDELFILRAGAEEPERIDLPQRDTFIAQMEHFVDCLQTGKAPIHGPQEGRDVLEVILQAAQNSDGWQDVAQVRR